MHLDKIQTNVNNLVQYERKLFCVFLTIVFNNLYYNIILELSENLLQILVIHLNIFLQLANYSYSVRKIII